MNIAVDARGLRTALKKLPSVTERALGQGLNKVSMHAYKRLIMLTPKGYTGQTRRSWYIKKNSTASLKMFEIANSSKIMRFLEEGTATHGPRKAKYLYVPLNRKASIKGWNKSLRFGKDYVLAKKVRGMKALKIVEKRTKIIQRQLTLVTNSIVSAIIRVL